MGAILHRYAIVRKTLFANYEIGLLLNLSKTMIILNYVYQYIPTPTVHTTIKYKFSKTEVLLSCTFYSNMIRGYFHAPFTDGNNVQVALLFSK